MAVVRKTLAEEVWKMKVGIYELIKSRKATMCILVLIPTFTALFLRLIDGPSVAAIVSSIVMLYLHAQGKVDAAVAANPPQPPTGLM